MRLDRGRLIDRAHPLRFTFDGVNMFGFQGDTLASALLANDVRLVGRSFKYHRPRGIMTAGSEEPNALVTVSPGQGQDPNVRATTLELYDGLQAESQNRWPTLTWDLLAVNDFAAPFLGAGFYYKTFMWPKGFWEKIYEPLIRRAAGLGALFGNAEEKSSEKAYAFCDVLVIGGGPAGLIAALEAGKAELNVILADEDVTLGGRLLSDEGEIDGAPSGEWLEAVKSELIGLENVRIFNRTTVTGVYDNGTFGALERVGHHIAVRPQGLVQDCFWRIFAKRTILASGALERFVAFANNDRPGIITASALRSYINRYGAAPGRAYTIFGNNDSAFETALCLQGAGLDIAAYVDSRSDTTLTGDFPIFRGAVVSNTAGRRNLQSITVRHIGGEDKISTDVLAVSGGWNPTIHLSCHMNGRPIWDEDTQSFVPQAGAIKGMFYAGACAGQLSTFACLRSGSETARFVIADLGAKAAPLFLPVAEDRPYNIRPLWSVASQKSARAWVDFQNDVTVKDIEQSVNENYRSVEHMKRYTTQGMATDQGKNSNVTALAVLADLAGRAITDIGTTTYRPPFSPVSIAAMGSVGAGKGFAPERFGSTHNVMVERAAPLIEVGLWYRPSYFPKRAEKTWRQSCDREVLAVRNAVGVCDVSTLGKIDIKGPNAAELLDFVYTNTFSTMPIGRMKYGLMLREDGCVMDDGTTARLGEKHYLMTTTTAAASQVMRHLEFVHQCLHPEWDVSFNSVTEHWTQFAIAGPKARQLLNAVLDEPLNDAQWPFMGCGSVNVLGVGGRLFRISFSGELGYELAVPSRFGESLFRILITKAEEYGGCVYGMEALNVLRVEKGFITHAEIDGRVTALDLGLQRMVSQKKDCIGKTASERLGLMDPERPRLVGLKTVGAVKQLTAGAHLFNEADQAESSYDQGFITSVAYSPVLERYHGLAFLKNGEDRMGERIRMVDHLRDIDALCEVIPPVAFDPEGGRIRA